MAMMTSMTQLRLVEKVLFQTQLPEGTEVWDFGGGNTVAPTPDLNNPGFITTHMVAVARVRKSTTDPVILTGFNFDLQFVTPRELQTGLQRAAQHNLTQTKQFEFLPKEQQ